MKRKEFEKLVTEGIDALPEWVRKKMTNVAVLIEDEPSAETLREEGTEEDETLLGLYRGVPLSERGDGYGVGGTLPDTITLYRLPLETEGGGDPDKIREAVRVTVWHEVAHHFGIDEERVGELEKERFGGRG